MGMLGLVCVMVRAVGVSVCRIRRSGRERLHSRLGATCKSINTRLNLSRNMILNTISQQQLLLNVEQASIGMQLVGRFVGWSVVKNATVYDHCRMYKMLIIIEVSQQ